MKKFIRHIFLFLLPVVMLLAISLSFPIQKRWQYEYTKDDCMNRGVWIHDRIFNNNTPIKIAFIGSSHTINGISDTLIASRLGIDDQVVNFGYCRLGRNLHYALLKDILKTQLPEKIILEMRAVENQHSHPIFPYVADKAEVYMPLQVFHKKAITDIYNASVMRWHFQQQELWNNHHSPPLRLDNFGFLVNVDTANIDFLNQKKLKRQAPITIPKDHQLSLPIAYLQAIQSLCEANKVELILLYLPAYGTYLDAPLDTTFLKNNTTILLPDTSILKNPNLWHDDEHFNKAGAEALSMWVAEKLSKR